MKHLAATLIGALTLHATATASLAAAPADEVRRQLVRFADLDLTRPAGAQELYRRIRHAAREVCEISGPGGYDRNCAERAIARAVAEVGAPLLTAQLDTLEHSPTSTPTQARLDR